MKRTGRRIGVLAMTGVLITICCLIMFTGCNDNQDETTYFDDEMQYTNEETTYVETNYDVDPEMCSHQYIGGICKNCLKKKDNWEICYYYDEFGRETDEPYIYCEYIKDDDYDEREFENDLLTITVENNTMLLQIYSVYGGQMDICRWFDGDKFDVSILNESGETYHSTATYSEAYEAIIPNDYTLSQLLQENQILKIYLKCETASRSSSGFLFTVDSSGFGEIYEEYLSLTKDKYNWEVMAGDYQGPNLNVIYYEIVDGEPYINLASYRGGHDTEGYLTVIDEQTLFFSIGGMFSFYMKFADPNTMIVYDCYAYEDVNGQYIRF